MTSLTASRPAASFEAIPTTTTARRPVGTEIEYDAPVLLIRKGRRECLYVVDEFPCGFDGRAFSLRHDASGEEYHVFLARNAQDTTCSCAGFTYTSNDPTGGRCKHTDAVRHLIDAGRLEDPRHAAPVEPWPSPEQAAAEAGVSLPF